MTHERFPVCTATFSCIRYRLTKDTHTIRQTGRTALPSQEGKEWSFLSHSGANSSSDQAEQCNHRNTLPSHLPPPPGQARELTHLCLRRVPLQSFNLPHRLIGWKPLHSEYLTRCWLQSVPRPKAHVRSETLRAISS